MGSTRTAELLRLSITLAVILPIMQGCGAYFLYKDLEIQSTIDDAIQSYNKASQGVALGDSKDKALGILMLTQDTLPPAARKAPEAYLEDNKGQSNTVEVFYFRSARQPDGLTTDDEFTPYVFRNNILTSIGWTALGGPKTIAQSRPAPQQVIHSNPSQSTSCYTIGNQTECTTH